MALLKKALCIGINNYRFRSLKHAVDDAKSISQILEMSEYEYEVELLTDNDATTRDIKSKLKKIFEANPDEIVIYFSGHAVIDSYSLHLVTIDADHIEPGFDFDEIRKYIKSLKNNSTKILIILDCCHAGQAAHGAYFNTENKIINSDDLISKASFLDSGRTLIGACAPNQISLEFDSLKAGIFTHYVIEGLSGEAADSNGEITVSNLYSYINRRFRELKIDQVPVFKGDLIGENVIGRQFPSKNLKDLDVEDINKIYQRAENLINDYKSNKNEDIDYWSSSGYKEACLRFEPIWKWLTNKKNEIKNLNKDERFLRYFRTAANELSSLGKVVEGFNTKHGIIESRLGSGGFGTVWKIKSFDDGLKAYKIFHPNDLDDDKKRDRFYRGFEAMSQLDHAHIVKVFNFSECPFGFTMDLIDGVNSRQIVSQISSDPIQLCHILYTIADTLKHAHSRNVIHRDIKPENIIIQTFFKDEDYENPIYEPYLTDFDLSWFESAKSIGTNEQIGTLLYAAPEQLALTKKFYRNPTVDIYSFGRLIYFYVTKLDPEPKYDSDHNLKPIKKALSSWPSGLASELLLEIYLKSTKINPDDRYESFFEVMDILTKIQQELNPEMRNRKMNKEQFIRELAFKLSGYNSSDSITSSSFNTNSGQCIITVTIDESFEDTYKCIFEIQALNPPVVTGASSFKDSRSFLANRIEREIPSSQDMWVKPLKTAAFGIFLHLRNIPLNLEGIEKCRHILTRAIDCIEKSN